MPKKEKELTNMKKLAKVSCKKVSYDPGSRAIRQEYNITDDDGSVIIADQIATKTLTENEVKNTTLEELETVGVKLAQKKAKEKYGKKEQ